MSGHVDVFVVRHLQRAAALLAGQRAVARLYLVLLALESTEWAEIEESKALDGAAHNRAREHRQSAVRYARALHSAGFLGTPAGSLAAALDAVAVHTLETCDSARLWEHIFASYARQINAAVDIDEAHGVFVEACVRRASAAHVKAGFYFPDAERTTFCPSRYFESRDEALVYAGRMVTLGEALIAAQLEVNRIAALAEAPTGKGQLSFLTTDARGGR